jgi:ferric iron reductase protein FhuF
VETIKNKKIRGAIKKQKDMIKNLNEKLARMRETREKCEELSMTMEFLDGGDIKPLKGCLRRYYSEHENE